MQAVLPLGSDFAAMNAFSSPPARTIGLDATVDAAAQDFEAMFATQMLQPMLETVPVDGLFGGGHGEEVMRTFMLQEYGKIVAKSGLLGIASQVKAEMLRVQEAAQAKNVKAFESGANAAIKAASDLRQTKEALDVAGG